MKGTVVKKCSSMWEPGHCTHCQQQFPGYQIKQHEGKCVEQQQHELLQLLKDKKKIDLEVGWILSVTLVDTFCAFLWFSFCMPCIPCTQFCLLPSQIFSRKQSDSVAENNAPTPKVVKVVNIVLEVVEVVKEVVEVKEEPYLEFAADDQTTDDQSSKPQICAKSLKGSLPASGSIETVQGFTVLSIDDDDGETSLLKPSHHPNMVLVVKHRCTCLQGRLLSLAVQVH